METKWWIIGMFSLIYIVWITRLFISAKEERGILSGMGQFIEGLFITVVYALIWIIWLIIT